MVEKKKVPRKVKRTAKRRATEQSGGETVGLKVTSHIESGRNKNIGLEYILPPDVPVHYVDNVNVLHTPSEFTISLMQAQPPLLNNAAAWDEVKSIPSKCVVRIIISPMKMESFIRALTGNFQAYVRTYLEQEADDGNDNDTTEANANAPKS
jgi:hypothetical protein